MTLPVTAGVTIPNPRLIDPGKYRAQIDLNVPGLTKEMTDLVAGNVFNTLATKANTNKLRTFAYNLVAKEDHKGKVFKELCEYSGRYSVLQYLKSRTCYDKDTKEDTLRNITQAINQSTPNAITLWLSSLFPRYPDLEYEVGSSVAHKAKSLTNKYLNSLKEIEGMFSNANQGQFFNQLMTSQGQMNPMNSVMQQMNTMNDPVVNFNIRGMSVQMPQSQAMQLKSILESNPMQAVQILANSGLPQVAQHLANQLQQQKFTANVQMNQGGFDIQGVFSQNNQQVAKPNLSGVFDDSINNQMTHRNTSNKSKIYENWLRENGRAHEIESVEIGNVTQHNTAALDNVTVINDPKADQVKVTMGTSSQGGNMNPLSIVAQAAKNIDVTFNGTASVSIIARNFSSIHETRKALQSRAVEALAVYNSELIDKLNSTEAQEEAEITEAYSYVSACDSVKTDNLNALLTKKVFVSKNINTEGDISSFLKKLNASCKNFKSLFDFIKSVTTVIDNLRKADSNIDSEAKDMIEAVIKVEDYLTTAVNHKLVNHFGMKITIDSAFNDYKDLKEHITKSMGEEVMELVDEAISNAIEEISIGTSDINAAFTEVASCIYIPYTEADLGLKNKGVPMITSDNNLEFMKEVFTLADSTGLDNAPSFTSCYLIEFKCGTKYKVEKVDNSMYLGFYYIKII